MSRKNSRDKLDRNLESDSSSAVPDEKSPKVPGGRPQQISDLSLSSRRNELFEALGRHWGELGWELKTARSPREVGTVLSSLAGLYPFLFDLPFLKKIAVTSASAEDLRKVRRRSFSIDEALRAARRAVPKQEKLVAEAQKALAQAQEGERQEAIDVVTAELTARTAKLKNLQSRLKKMNSESESLRAELKNLGACYAETEVFKLIKSRNYRLTPKTFANAMAGLPYIGWRQSLKRCAKIPLRLKPSGLYCVFEAVCYILNKGSRPLTENDPLTLFKKGIATLPKRGNYEFAQEYLLKNWIHLKRALKNTWYSRIGRDELPYRITAAFEESIRHPPTVLERLLAEKENQ